MEDTCKSVEPPAWSQVHLPESNFYVHQLILILICCYCAKMKPVEIKIRVLPSYFGYIIRPKVLLSFDEKFLSTSVTQEKNFGFLNCYTTPHH